MNLRKVPVVCSKIFKSLFSINVANIILLRLPKQIDHMVFLNRIMQISAQKPIRESFDLYLRKCISHDLSWLENTTFVKYPKEDPELPPLARAWVFQESILLPELPHSTRDELLWECTQNVKCEYGKHRYAYDLHKTDMSEALVASDQPAHEINSAWHDVVAGYTSKNSTYDQDR